MLAQVTFYKKYYMSKIDTITTTQPYKIILTCKY